MPDPPNIWEEDGYPPAAFYFRVVFDRSTGISDVSFQEVSGISSEIDFESVVEGGENRFVHRLPKGVRHPKLVLKRGIAKKNSGLVEWCRSVLEQFKTPIEPKAIQVRLLNENGDPIRSWAIAGAYPVKWEVGNLNSTKNEVAIETIELSYATLTRFI
ncbi:MAG: phage tail protein [Nitrospira sp.]